MDFADLVKQKKIDLQHKGLRDGELDVLTKVLQKSKVLEYLNLGNNRTRSAPMSNVQDIWQGRFDELASLVAGQVDGAVISCIRNRSHLQDLWQRRFDELASLVAGQVDGTVISSIRNRSLARGSE